jgi:hypothetical protein
MEVKMDSQTEQKRELFLKEYRQLHGHHPSDYRAQMQCKVCNERSARLWQVISKEVKENQNV